MQETEPISRRGVLSGLVSTGVAAIVASLVAACASAQPAASTAPRSSLTTTPTTVAQAATDTDIIMMIRHAEKPTGASGSPQGITTDGTASAGSLTVTGWVRAGALVALLASARGAPPAGLRTPTSIWAADPRGDEGQRPLQTVSPLAERLGITVNTQFGKGHTTDLAPALVAGHGATLVSWQHQEIPVIVARLGTVTPKPPPYWPNERFDIIWAFTRIGDGWTFSQIPQLLLAGDRADPIT